MEHLKGASFWVTYGLTRKHLTRLGKIARDKRSSLLSKFINYGLKKFYNFDPRCQCFFPSS
jgi:hypothetical protein